MVERSSTDEPEETITIGQNKYLNNLVEQGHGKIKRRIRRYRGSNSFDGYRRFLPI